MDPKYIRFRRKGAIIPDYDFCLIFASTEIHWDVAQNLTNCNPISAGFVGKDYRGGVEAYGESSSLGIKSDPKQDTMLLNYILRDLVK
jgi:hypothetical protein